MGTKYRVSWKTSEGYVFDADFDTRSDAEMAAELARHDGGVVAASVGITTEQAVRLGNAHDAFRASLGYDDNCTCGCGDADTALWLYGDPSADDPRLTKRFIGAGESRSVWLVNGVVYKTGRWSANEWEHDLMTQWREAGAVWAPMTSLWRTGDEVVLAMTYLPDDGGDVDAATLADIKRAAPQTCSENVVSHGGHTYLIDGGDIQNPPPRQHNEE